MPNHTEGCGGTLSRRLLLQSTLGSLGVAAAVAAQTKRASAVIKISKAAVAYQDHPEGDKHCAKCMQFLPPNSCKMVDGPISPQGFCRIFAPSRQAAGPVQAAPAIG